MKLFNLAPMLTTDRIKETIEFYQNTLDFECESFDEGWGWASLKKDDLNIMLGKPNAHIPFEKACFTGSFYFNTDNVNELWEKVKDKARVCYPPENFEYGMREFAIYDNNGYLLQFGQEITNSNI